MSGAEFPVYARSDLDIARAEGVHIETADGHRLIDFYGGHAVAALGYAHPGLLARLSEQAERLFFQTNLVDLEVRREAHEALAALAPGDLNRVFLVNSGAEANENALRLAFRGGNRHRVVALEGGFHGRTAAAGACTWNGSGWYGFPSAPFEVTFVPPDDSEALCAAIDDDVAALIVEPVQGVAGARDLDLDWLRTARELTDRHGVFLVSDEIQCGMGRTGHAFAIEAAGVVPDIITTAKGLAGGFPAGAVIARAEAADALDVGAMGTTFGGGPLACALITEVVAAIRGPGFLENVQALGSRIAERCVRGPVQSVQGRGLLMGLVCDRPARDVLPGLRERGIFAGGASDPSVVRLMPPLVLEAEHVDALSEALADLPQTQPHPPGGASAVRDLADTPDGPGGQEMRKEEDR